MVGDYEHVVAKMAEQLLGVWCRCKKEDEEARARWRMCAGAVALIDIEFHPVPRTHVVSQKGPLDGADPPSFSVGVVDPAQSSRGVPVNLILQLTRRENSSVIKGETCRCCQTVPNVRL